MRALLLLAALAPLVACDEDAALPRAEDPESTFSFALLEEAVETAQDRRVAWRMHDGVTVTAQRMPTSDSTVRERTVEMVARAMVTRFEAGEVEGTMSRMGCEAGGVRTSCTAGWMALPEAEGGERFVRRGVLVPIRDEIVLLEVLGPESLHSRVEEQSALLRRTLTVWQG